MFFVFNKPKIYSYLIVLSTVVVLFFTAEVLSESNNIETLTTSTEILEENNTIINRFNTDKKEIAITINCIDSDKNIEDILNILEKNNVNASFGIYGEWIKKYPEITKRINDSGNSIIALSDKYRDISNLEYEEITKEISESINKINTLLNKKINLIRCPYGKYSENIIKIAEQRNYKIIGWSIDTLDYQGLEANVIWDNVKNKITNGDIILMNSNSENIIEELDLIINSIKQRGFSIEKLEERV